ncbi:MAG: hypothetical protein KDK91_01290 [Gammaproteobacteria bacterium]|nr:hypothetical protein [Gammaproteobacteria bacterium]
MLQLATKLSNVSRASEVPPRPAGSDPAGVGSQVSRPSSIEHLHRTLLDEHFHVEGRRPWFETIGEMQAVLDTWLDGYNHRWPQPAKGARTPAAEAA